MNVCCRPTMHKWCLFIGNPSANTLSRCRQMMKCIVYASIEERQLNTHVHSVPIDSCIGSEQRVQRRSTTVPCFSNDIAGDE